jgi:hypothetical protein
MKRNLQDDVRKLMGLYPHNTWSNPCAGDGYFMNDCKAFWGEKLFDKAIRIESDKFKLDSNKSK